MLQGMVMFCGVMVVAMQFSGGLGTKLEGKAHCGLTLRLALVWNLYCHAYASDRLRWVLNLRLPFLAPVAAARLRQAEDPEECTPNQNL